MGGEVVEAHDGLFALMNRHRLDHKTGTHPLELSSWTSFNCYLLTTESRSLLYNTGFSIHETGIIQQLGGLLDDRPLDIVIPRPEFFSMCNARPVADAFNVHTVYQRIRRDPRTFLDFRPEIHQSRGKVGGLAKVIYAPIQTKEPIFVDGRNGRPLQMLLTKLRLLPSNWAYDVDTKTLFTGDMFSWITSSTESGPWVLSDSAEDPSTFGIVREFLVRNRYWWLPGSNTLPLRQELTDLFERYEVKTIAPDYGALLRGPVVNRNVQLLDDVLASLANEESVGIEAGRWSGPKGYL